MSKKKSSVFTKKYLPGEGASFGKEKAQIYGECLEALHEKHGLLTPKVIVSAARKESSPIHDYFEWDDGIAADKHRLYQARKLTNRIMIAIIDSRGEDELVHNFFSVTITDDIKGEPQKGYVTIEKVASNREFNKQVVENALKELRTWQQNYQQYTNLKRLKLVIKAVNGALA